MSYSREQRIANAAKQANKMAAAATAAGLGQPSEAASVEPKGEAAGEAPPAREPFDLGKRNLENTPRGQALREVEERHSREQPQEPAAVEPASEPVTTTSVVSATPAALDASAPIPAVPATPAVPMAKVKVDGEEFEVPQADVDEAGGVKTYQIQRAAENRLKKSNDVLAEARRMHTEAVEFSKRNATPPTPQVTDNQFIQEQMDVIRFGTAEDAAKALIAVSTRLNPRMNENELIIKANSNARHDAALGKFRADFQDVTSNPVLAELVPIHAQRELAPMVINGVPDWSKIATLDWDAFYAKIGNKIRGAVPRPSQPQPAAQQQTPGSPSQATDRDARKASITTIPTAAARAAMPEESKPESREDVLESMKKARKIPSG